ncbi:MAG TPA: alpha/beta fold hydrolase [Nocardioidaceae bacterium]
MSTTAPETPGRTAEVVPANGGRSRAHRFLIWTSVIALLLVGLFYAGGGWYFAGEIRDGITVTAPQRDLDLTVVAVSDDTVTLEPREGEAPTALESDKVFGLDWNGGYGHLEELRDVDGGQVTRSFTLLEGTAPVSGARARIMKEAFTDPELALDVPVEDVTFESDGRTVPAWYAPGEGTTWAILVHGKGVTRSELLRLMRTTTDLGFPSLNIAYRRDPEMGGGLIRFGQDEWPDLEAAVRYALDNGAQRVVLVGCSSGGAISASFLDNSDLADRAVAAVFDAPMLDFGATVSHGAADRTLPMVGTEIPSSLVWVARRIADVRFDIDGARTSYLDDTDWLTVPTLVFHGTEDQTVPYTVTERLDAAAPELVDHLLVDGADHVESWNVEPEVYDDRVRDFLEEYAPVSSGD